MHSASKTESTTPLRRPSVRNTTGTLTIGVALAFAALLAFIAASAAFSLANLRTVYGAADAVAHTNAVKTQLATVLATVTEAETGERGYIITNRTSYLDPYDRAVAAVGPELDGLRALIGDSPDQRTDLFELSTLAREKLAETATAIERRRNAGFDEAQAVILTNVGKQTMDEMRAIVARMDVREDAVLLARTAQANDAYRAARLTSVGVAAVGLIVTGGLFMATRRVGKQRRVALNLAEELRVTLAELEAAVSARDDFLSVASHELRNPINAVQLQLIGILKAFERASGDVRPADVRDRVVKANAQVGRLTRLMDNLMDVSRIGAGSLGLEPEPVNLVDLVQTVIAQFQEEAAPGQVTFVADCPVVGQWDRLRVEQIVSNVLSNAIKYGNGQPIMVSLGCDEFSARLAIQDHGIGIAADDHARMFARFERGVSRQQYGGFGLGLWITRQLVEAMGGSISVDSRPGDGATFSIVLPIEGATRSGMREPAKTGATDAP